MMILAGETCVLPALGFKGTFFTENDKLYDLGLKGIEVSFGAQEEHGLWVGSLSKSQIKRINKSLSKFKRVGVHVGFMELSLLSGHPGVRKITMEECLATLELASAIGAKTVVLHDGTKGTNLTQDQVESLMTESLIKIDRKARQAGVLACWETGAGDFFWNLERFESLRKLSLKNSGICIDTGNLTYVWKGRPDEKKGWFSAFIERHKDRIWHLHLSDWQEHPKGKHKWDRHHAVGDGELPWEEIFSALVRIGYDGLLTMEYHPDAIKSEPYFLKNCEYIKKLIRDAGGEVI